ncbi:MAG TPA: ABC transporter substrate-binding protein [Thermomicrobiales bacterium]|nr:ABC transporter substrate-binding protein [Thermomicrobiales bacterium]
MNPHRAINWAPHWILLPYVWEGLLGFDAQGEVVPVLASAIEAEEDGLVWVATIRPEASFVSGNPVTAEAMITGWKRALQGQRIAPMSPYMRRVEGFEDFVAGESEDIGFEARDERRVAIRLAEPYALFPEDLATFVWAAVDVTALAELPESQIPFSDASAGRWRFVEISETGDIVMALRDDPTDAPSPFSRVTWRPFEGPLAAEEAVEALRENDIALADAPAPIHVAIEDEEQPAGNLEVIEPLGSTMLIGMDFGQEPFSDPRVRRAIGHAIDRKRWATEIMGGEFVPAESITPPVIAETSGYSSPELLVFDPELARSLIREAGITEEAMPTISYFQPADTPEPEVEEAAALLAMIQENSGLIIEHNRSLTAEQIDARRQDEGGLQLDLRWWWPLTNSPSGLADLGLPASTAMDGWFNWSGSLENADVAEAALAFEEIIDEAQTTMDQTERSELFASAETLLVETAVYIPLGHWIQAFLRSDQLQGTRHGAFTGYMPIAFDEEVEWTPPGEGTPSG